MRDDLNKLFDMIDELETAMLTTRRPDGHLVSRAMATQKRAPGADIWFVTAEGSGKLDELAHDQHVNLAYYKDGTREWISVSGLARVSRDRQTIRQLFQPDWKNLVCRRRQRPALRNSRRSPDGARRRRRALGGLPRSQQATAGGPLRDRQRMGHRDRTGARTDARSEEMNYRFLVDFLERERGDGGTLPPFSRASLSPIAIACLRLVTF